MIVQDLPLSPPPCGPGHSHVITQPAEPPRGPLRPCSSRSPHIPSQLGTPGLPPWPTRPRTTCLSPRPAQLSQHARRGPAPGPRRGLRPPPGKPPAQVSPALLRGLAQMSGLQRVPDSKLSFLKATDPCDSTHVPLTTEAPRAQGWGSGVLLPPVPRTGTLTSGEGPLGASPAVGSCKVPRPLPHPLTVSLFPRKQHLISRHSRQTCPPRPASALPECECWVGNAPRPPWPRRV